MKDTGRDKFMEQVNDAVQNTTWLFVFINVSCVCSYIEHIVECVCLLILNSGTVNV